MNDILLFSQWYIMLLLLGLLFLPITQRLFSTLFDGGYIFAKVIGTITISYIIFTLSTLHILPFSAPTVIVIALLLGILPNVPGFLLTIKVISADAVPAWIAELYNYAWFVGFFVSGTIYYLTMKGQTRLELSASK